MYDVCLASSSPRRIEILTQLGVRFFNVSPDIDESRRDTESASDYVQRMAIEKAEAGLVQLESSLPVIGSDTSVVVDGETLGKPENEADAVRMLCMLSGRTHQVLSAVAVIADDQRRVLMSTTDVCFRDISEKECLGYYQTGEPIGKAGSYAIQGKGSIFVANISGSYSGVVGLPIYETTELLQSFAIPIWQN